MHPTTIVLLVVTLSVLFRLGSGIPSRRSMAYYDPSANGGSMLDNAGDGLGEPLNVIISGLSSPGVFTDDGIINYARAIGFSTECLGIHIGSPQSANLGDGNGWVAQSIELRHDYGNGATGACIESIFGGNHFRVFRQNGSLSNSGALFLAVSKEKARNIPFTSKHTIVANGYDVGRDDLVSAAVGWQSHGGVTYSTSSEDIIGLLAAGSEGINHGISQDGVVKLLTVTIV